MMAAAQRSSAYLPAGLRCSGAAEHPLKLCKIRKVDIAVAVEIQALTPWQGKGLWSEVAIPQGAVVCDIHHAVRIGVPAAATARAFIALVRDAVQVGV